MRYWGNILVVIKIIIYRYKLIKYLKLHLQDVITENTFGPQHRWLELLITLRQTYDKFDIDTSYLQLLGKSWDMDIDTWIEKEITIPTCASVYSFSLSFHDTLDAGLSTIRCCTTASQTEARFEDPCEQTDML